MEQDFPVNPESDDSSAERALERLASGWIPQDSAVADSGDAAIRADLEALALLAYELEAEAPGAATKQNLMAQIRAQAGTQTESSQATSVPPQRSAVDVTLQHTVRPSPAEGPSRMSESRYFEATEKTAAEKTLMMGVPAEVVAMRPPSRSNLPMTTFALAAGLAFCLVGLGYLYGQVNAKNAMITVQAERLELSRDLESELERSRDDLRRIQDSLAMVTTVAQTAYPLRPATTVGNAGAAALAAGRAPTGKVFVCGQHQRWYLSLTDLEAPPEGEEYHLWYLTEDGAVDAGKVAVVRGIAKMQDLTMPDGTQGFQITLEPIGGGDIPAGKTIMVGDRPVNL